MKQIIPFKKELPFKTKVSDITSISLERKFDVTDDGIVSGIFHITGDYKMNEGSINRECFSFELPFDITLDPRYDVKTVNADIEDFYYDVLNEDTLKVNIDLFIEADYLPEPVTFDGSELCDMEEVRGEIDKEINEVVEKEEFSNESELVVFDKNEEIREETVTEDVCLTQLKDDNRDDAGDFTADLFSNLDNTETYTTYYVYIVKEDDTVDKILLKYGITKEELESYNDIAEIKPGSKVIIPKKCEE